MSDSAIRAIAHAEIDVSREWFGLFTRVRGEKASDSAIRAIVHMEIDVSRERFGLFTRVRGEKASDSAIRSHSAYGN